MYIPETCVSTPSTIGTYDIAVFMKLSILKVFSNQLRCPASSPNVALVALSTMLQPH